MPSSSQRLLLGIEGGATRTVMLLTTPDLEIVRRMEAGSGNIRLLTDPGLVRLLRSVGAPARNLQAVAIGLAGARTAEDRRRIKTAAATVWPGIPCYATHDLETALTAATLPISKTTRSRRNLGVQYRKPGSIQVLVLSGTGSCCYGRSASGQIARTGGWGHILGDRGSAYAIGRQALQEVLVQYDHRGRCPDLGSRLLRSAGLNHMDECIEWFKEASKASVAALAVEVFEAARSGDRCALRIIRTAAQQLSEDACACARKLHGNRSPTDFVLAGGLLLHQTTFLRAITHQLRAQEPGCRIQQLRHESAWGAVELARQLTLRKPATDSQVPRDTPEVSAEPSTPVSTAWLQASPTEQPNPRSAQLDRMPLGKAIDLFLSEDTCIVPALRKEHAAVERACRAIARALKQGGRLFYVGAGTSGRLGVLDASECPPTFRTPPDQVQAIIAGGPRALREAVEGAEDDAEGGRQAVLDRGVRRRDVVVGIAASGRTPFVWGALTAANRLKATTVLLCFNPALKNLRRDRPTIIIAPDLGPELLTGSTRLKSGTATKTVLNLFSTLAMVQLGKVLGNLMVDLHPSNSKLRARAIRLVQTATGTSADRASEHLKQTRWNVRKAIQRCAYKTL